jgi:hypothetical protein
MLATYIGKEKNSADISPSGSKSIFGNQIKLPDAHPLCEGQKEIVVAVGQALDTNVQSTSEISTPVEQVKTNAL